MLPKQRIGNLAHSRYCLSAILSIPRVLGSLRIIIQPHLGSLEMEEIKIRATEYLEDGLRGDGAQEGGY